jgi:arabinofuranosyltransferase
VYVGIDGAGFRRERRSPIGKRLLIYAGLALLIVLGLLLLHSAYYAPFLSDDSLISLRYAQRLLRGEGLTWTDGRPVEGYSNLLWILIIAGMGALGADLIDAARVLGLLGMSIVAVPILLWYASTDTLRRTLLALVVGILFFCLAAPVAVWAIGGMEQPLLAALLAAAIPLCFAVMESGRPAAGLVLLASLPLGLICITRPDGPVFVLAAVISVIAAGRLSGRTRALRVALLIMLCPLLLYLGQTAFRYFYYGQLLPNTALVKITPSTHHFLNGLRYIMGGMRALLPFSLLAVLALVWGLVAQQTRQRATLLLSTAGLWLAYLVFIGGDIFPASRHFLPVIVVFSFALVEGMRLAYGYVSERRGMRWPYVAAGLVALFAVYSYVQFTDARNRRAVTEQWEWDGKVVGLLLKAAFSREEPLIAVSAAGCIPYWSELPALDMMGLSDYYLPRHPPADLGRGSLGHELGDGRYVLSRAPDIICFHTGRMKALFRSGREMQETEEFYELYTPVRLRGTSPHEFVATLWIRRSSDGIGISRSDREVTVPGFLLNANPNTIAYLNERDRLVVAVSAGQPAGVVLDFIPPETWEIDIAATHPEEIKTGVRRLDGSAEIVLSTDREEPIEVQQIVLSAVAARD